VVAHASDPTASSHSRPEPASPEWQARAIVHQAWECLLGSVAPGSSHKTMTAGIRRGIPLIRVGVYRGKPARGGADGPSPLSALWPPEDPRSLVQQPVCLPAVRMGLRRGGAAGGGPDGTAASADGRETGSRSSAPPLSEHIWLGASDTEGMSGSPGRSGTSGSGTSPELHCQPACCGEGARDVAEVQPPRSVFVLRGTSIAITPEVSPGRSVRPRAAHERKNRYLCGG
jgi:hypothetical protein